MNVRLMRKKRINRVGTKNYLQSSAKDGIDYSSYERKLFEGKRNLIQRLFQNDDFVEFYEELIMPMTDPPSLRGTADIDGKMEYDIIRADVFSSWVSEMRSIGGLNDDWNG